MRSGFNYGLLFTVGGVAILWIGVEATLWWSRRAERRSGARVPDVTDRLTRAEAAIDEAKTELASIRSELAMHR